MADDARGSFDELIDQVLDRDPGERRAFILEACKDDVDLRDRLLAMLHANDAMDDVLGAAGKHAESLLGEATGEPDGGDAEPPLPKTIGPYEVLDRLGAGGMGTVYLARHAAGELDRDVALKVVGHAGAASQVLKRFRAEQRILSRLEHPNIARLYDVGVDDSGAPYFVMERVEGLPIDRFADDRRLNVAERLALVRQLTDALAYAHRNLVVHRDIKPSNILVTEGGVVKLLDFGVAKLLESEETESDVPETRMGARPLTPEYASPEQVRGEPVSTASDVYATGVLLYELLTGFRPYTFTSRSPIHIEQVVSQQEPEPPSVAAARADTEEVAARSTSAARLARVLTRDLDWIVLKSLRKEPAARYGSVQELAADLERYLADEPVHARPLSFRYRARKFAARHKRGLVAAALVLLSLIGGLLATRMQATEARRQAQRAERVRDLVVGLFESSDPDESQGATLTALEILERGETTLLEGLEDEPEIRSELMRIVGSIYTTLGEYERASPLLEASLGLNEELGGDEGIAETLSSLAELRFDAGDFEDGEQLARRQLALRRELDDPESIKLATALSNLSVFLSALGKYEEAEALLLEALEIDRRADATENEAIDWNSLSILRGRQGDYDGAIAAAERSVSAQREYKPGDHTGLATGLASLGDVLMKKGEFDRADTAMAQALAMRRRLLGNEHAHVALALNGLALLRQVQQRYSESIELHEEALAIRRGVFGDDHPDVAGSINNLGLVNYYQGDYAGAEAAFRDALRIFRLHREEDHPVVLTLVNNVAATLREQGDLDEAEALFDRILETRTQLLGPDHHDTGGAWNNLGGIRRNRGDFVGAEDAHRRAVEIFARALSPGHGDLINALQGLARSLVQLGRHAEALESLEQACPHYLEQFGAESFASAECQGLQGLALVGAGRPAEARQHLSGAVVTLEAERPDDDWTLRVREALDRLGPA